jgi:hypothetical protein
MPKRLMLDVASGCPDSAVKRVQFKDVRIRSISSLICNFSILSRQMVSVSGCGRLSSSNMRDSSEAWRSLRVSSRAFRLMSDFSPNSAGCFAAIPTTLAVLITATHGSAAARCDASEKRVKDYGSAGFFRGKQEPC